MIPDVPPAAERLIKRHEGRRLLPYKDERGLTTIGYGRCIDRKGISSEEAEHLLANDLVDATLIASDFVGPAWAALEPARQAVLVDLAHQLGRHGLNQFRDLFAALHAGDHEGVAREILDSRAARQSGRRYGELAAIWLTADVDAGLAIAGEQEALTS